MALYNFLEFSNGLVYHDNIQMFINPTMFFVTSLNFYLKCSPGNDIKSLLRKPSLVDSKILYDKVSKKSNNPKKNIDDFLEIINCWGFGFIELKFLTDRKVIFSQRKPHLSKLYFDIFDEKLEILLEEIVAGFVENFLSCLFQKEVEVNPLKTSGDGILYDCLVTEKKFSFETDKFYEEKKPVGEVTRFVKRLILNKEIGSKNGVFQISNLYSLCLPMFFLFDFFKILGTCKCGKRFYLNSVQGKIMVDLNRRDNDLSNDELFEKVFCSLNVCGTGLFKPISYKDKIFSYENNFYSHFSKFYSNCDINYFSNFILEILQGIYEFTFDEKIEYTFDLGKVHINSIGGRRNLAEIELNILKNINLNKFICK